MTPVDRDILEVLHNAGGPHELVLSPRIIAENIDWSRQTVRDHIMALRDRGLIEYYDETGGIYQLSDRGRSYLEGDLDAADLESESE
nr:winged helix-turn-helix domain-containing protein [Natrinema sp. DC36]